MKTFAADCISLARGLGLPVSEAAALANRPWVALGDVPDETETYIFHLPDYLLSLKTPHKTLAGTWQHIFPDGIVICLPWGNALFTIAFADNTVLALRQQGEERYALLVSAEAYENYLDSPDDVDLYLRRTYGHRLEQHTPHSHRPAPPPPAHPDVFIPEEYPNLLEDMQTIRYELKHVFGLQAADMLLSYCRNHAIHAADVHHNPEWANMLLDGKVPCETLEWLYKAQAKNPAFTEAMETWVRRHMNGSPATTGEVPAYTLHTTGRTQLPHGTPAQCLQVHFANGKQATIYYADESGEYLYYDTSLHNYLSFATAADCIQVLYGLQQA